MSYTLYDFEWTHPVHPGSIVKLTFEPVTPGLCTENMWVVVESIDGDRYHGRLDSHPVSLPLKHGDPVDFELRNVRALCEGPHPHPETTP